MVLVSGSVEGVWIHGRIQPIDAASTARISVEDGRLVIDAPGALTLTSGKSRIEIDADGRIRIEGKQYATVVEGNLRLQGSLIELN
jgi:hypothetical protein